MASVGPQPQKREKVILFQEINKKNFNVFVRTAQVTIHLLRKLFMNG